ncbi:MAG TPA: alpha-amylase family glycosyl hydrolase, partial [Candidatus Saccharimonadales bacterium]|nr:alpha-amylase family glycosyl hydrolase [Candidatus Saccharimonadales bacterium]
MTFEFHVSREARERYGVDEALFTLTGNVVLPNLAASRRLAARMNQRLDAARHPNRVVHGGQLNAMGLIDEILHRVVELYRHDVNPGAMRDALAAVADRVGAERLEETLGMFVKRFPTAQAYRDGTSPSAYLGGQTDGVPNREIAVQELLLLWLANANPAFAPFEELFDDEALRDTPYSDVVAGLIAFFATQPAFGPESQTLIEMLRSPAIAVPDSLAGQLRFVRERWTSLLGEFLDRLIVNLDVVAQEELDNWRRFHPTGGGGGGAEDAARRSGRAWLAESGWYGRGEGESEEERFSTDRDWMPRLVLLAKSTYVWLDQLSRQYGREIARLDQIPDEELDRLARWGFTGLWLIGLWQRSHASQRIKVLRGNPEAVASAYSLDDYRIADDLGGEEAFERLKSRAWARGVRIASDMVPNHMGIDSRWVMEHPDWFISVPAPPYPAYSFSGPDLSNDQRVEIYLEDHYFDNTDAAVVFKRVDHWTGDERYVYHGNDGTSMPWNDTAQLNYLREDVREAVIQTILGVARRSPVIRFDAAMTLAKRHIERLWFPEPGHGGGIPSRAEHAMPKDDFERLMPVEFWREVVDRVASEVPDTLLLAEAFWLMEGYFVRTLGMHRVYNSAFMNMLRDEQNANYRSVIKNTIEFDPEVLKRYVNFMNNPDERTAVDQFGKGD